MKKVPKIKSLIDYLDDINNKFENELKYQIFFAITMAIPYLIIIVTSFLFYPFYYIYSKIILHNYNTKVVKLHFYSTSNSIIKTKELARIYVAEFVSNYIPSDLSEIFVKWEKINDLNNNHYLYIDSDNFYKPIVIINKLDSKIIEKRSNSLTLVNNTNDKIITNPIMNTKDTVELKKIDDSKKINTKKYSSDINKLKKMIQENDIKNKFIFKKIQLEGISNQKHQVNIKNLNIGDKISLNIIHNNYINKDMILVTDISNNKLGFIPNDLNNEYLYKIKKKFIMDVYVHEIKNLVSSKYAGLIIMLKEKDVTININLINKKETSNVYIRPNTPFHHYFDQNNLVNDDEVKITELMLAGAFFENRRQMIVKLKKGDPLILIRQPDNPFDSNAILVCDNLFNELGYIPRYLSHKYSLKLQRNLILNVVVNKVDYSKGISNSELLIHIHEKISSEELVPLISPQKKDIKVLNFEVEVMGTKSILIQKRLRSTYKNDIVSLYVENDVVYVKNKLGILLGYIRLSKLKEFNVDLNLISSYDAIVSNVHFNKENTLMLLFITITNTNKPRKINNKIENTSVKKNRIGNIYIQDNFVEEDFHHYLEDINSDLNRTIMEDFEKNEIFNETDFEPPIDFEF